MDKKRMVIRISRVAPKRYLIEQKRKFLWFWEFWQKGCPSLDLKKFYSSKLTAKTAITTHAKKKDVPVTLIYTTT